MTDRLGESMESDSTFAAPSCLPLTLDLLDVHPVLPIRDPALKVRGHVQGPLMTKANPHQGILRTWTHISGTHIPGYRDCLQTPTFVCPEEVPLQQHAPALAATWLQHVHYTSCLFRKGQPLGTGSAASQVASVPARGQHIWA